MNYFKLIPEKNLKSLENVGLEGSRWMAQTPGEVSVSDSLLVLGKLESHWRHLGYHLLSMYVGLDM